MLDDDRAAQHDLVVGVGEQVEQAVVPLLGLKHLRYKSNIELKVNVQYMPKKRDKVRPKR